MSAQFRWIWIILLMPLLQSCNDDLEYDVKSASTKMVVNSINGRDSLFRIEVSTTANPGKGNRIQSLTNARIFLTEDGVSISDFVLDSTVTTPWYMMSAGKPGLKKLYFFRSEYSRVKSGRTYRLEVEHDKFETVSSSIRIPRSCRAKLLPSRANSSLLLDGKNMAEIIFELVDDGRENYYALELVTREKKKSTPQKLIFFSTDKVFLENLTTSDDHSGQGAYYLTNGGVYFSNKKFRNQKRSFTILVEAEELLQNDVAELRVISLSSELYHFATSWQRQRANAGDPFAQPVPVFSNILNGLGVFAGYSVTNIPLK